MFFKVILVTHHHIARMSFAHRLDGGPTSARCGEVSARRHSPTCRSTNLQQAGRCHSSYPDFCAGVMELLACGKPLFQYFYVGDPYERGSKACGLLRDVATCKYLSCKYKNKYWCCLTAQVLIGCKYKQYVIMRQQNRTLNSFEENWLEQSFLHVLWISTTECCKKRPNGSPNHMLRHRNACFEQKLLQVPPWTRFYELRLQNQRRQLFVWHLGAMKS